MTAFIVKFLPGTETRYIVKDPQCLGKTCLSLGTMKLYRHRLSFHDEPIEIDCCTTMIAPGCPKDNEELFSMEERKNNTDLNFGIRLI